MLLLPSEVEDKIPPPIFFLWWLAKLTNAVGSPLPPPIRFYIAAGQTGYLIGKTLGEHSAELNSRGIYNPMTNLYTPEIMAYEHSALGSSRIL